MLLLEITVTWASSGSPPPVLPDSAGSSACLRLRAAPAAPSAVVCQPSHCVDCRAETRRPPWPWLDTVAVCPRDPAACCRWLACSRRALHCRRRGWWSSYGGWRALLSRLSRSCRQLQPRKNNNNSVVFFNGKKFSCDLFSTCHTFLVARCSWPELYRKSGGLPSSPAATVFVTIRRFITTTQGASDSTGLPGLCFIFISPYRVNFRINGFVVSICSGAEIDSHAILSDSNKGVIFLFRILSPHHSKIKA